MNGCEQILVAGTEDALLDVLRNEHWLYAFLKTVDGLLF
jgi:hypothetical protein